MAFDEWQRDRMPTCLVRNVEHCCGAASSLCGFHVTESALKINSIFDYIINMLVDFKVFTF